MDFVWGVVEHVLVEEPEFYVLPREAADEINEVLALFDACSTWGDLRRMASPERHREILGLAGYGELGDVAAHLMIGRPVPGAMASALESFDADAQPPGDDELFDPFEDVAAAGDGDYPSDPRYVMNLTVPGDIIDHYGERFETVFNGVYARFPALAAAEVVNELRRRGHTCTEDPDLITGCFPR